MLKIRSSSLGATDGGQSSTPPVLSSQLSVSSNPPEADNFASEANANTNFIATQAAPKRSVTFRDGIRPGDDADETSSAVVNNGSALTNEELSRSAPQLLGKMFGGRNGGTEAKKVVYLYIAVLAINDFLKLYFRDFTERSQMYLLFLCLFKITHNYNKEVSDLYRDSSEKFRLGFLFYVI